MNIEKERFEAWLMSQPGERKIDISDPCGCLAHHFINDSTGEFRRIGAYTHVTENYEDMQWLPGWFTDFLNHWMMARFISCAEVQAHWRKCFPEPDPIIKPSPRPSLCKSI